MARSDYRQEGRKFDGEKFRPSLLPSVALEAFLGVLEHGAQKYGFRNWQNVEPEGYAEAIGRHYLTWMQHFQDTGSPFAVDEESGHLHLAHIGVNCMFLLWFGGQSEDNQE